MLNELQLRLAIAGALVAAALVAGLTIWALLERSGRLEAKAELVVERDQVKVLADRLGEQTRAVEALGQASAGVRGELLAAIGKLAPDLAGTRSTIAKLERKLQAPTPKAPDGRTLDCRDALREWREAKP